jgi:hypothetical protein
MAPEMNREEATTRRRGPLGALDSQANKNREGLLFRLPCDIRRLSGGSDETRTRDLRRDRPAF